MRYNCGNGEGMFDHPKGAYVTFEDAQRFAQWCLWNVEEHESGLWVIVGKSKTYTTPELWAEWERCGSI